MKLTGASQSILITGITGSGKTEATKHIIQFLCARPSTNHSVSDAFFKANVILETFGNARTIGNENSSRFCKFIEVRKSHEQNLGLSSQNCPK